MYHPFLDFLSSEFKIASIYVQKKKHEIQRDQRRFYFLFSFKVLLSEKRQKKEDTVKMSGISLLAKSKYLPTSLRPRSVRFVSSGNVPKISNYSTHQTKSHFANAATKTTNLEEAIRSDFYGVMKRDYHEEHLSSEQVEEFNENGFVKTPELFSPTETQELIDFVTEVQRWKETPFKWMQYFEYYGENKTRELCRTENFFSYHPALQNLIVPKLLPMLAQLFGEPAVMYKEKINYKLANGGPFPAHQDAPAYGTFGHKYHITALIAIDDANEQNGCLEFVRNTHKDLVILPHNAAGVIDPKVHTE
ncbi:Phytanoyl-CoA dioxygenase [Reticulomyxa filosa]|uniref:Phytanoyl-CoA dioxygenase n=1 Tax=Reticulomyxa filosa TaxID=46433 RepID=X6MRZ9_RETFI|nr:Phytanoyl-CoA dioxygenase [Reticulomyxa filosa]|eukprot:ETO16416.1 Phytanoyl-CoA dioxygenase [Reticulomyxa filosa]